MTGTAVGTPAKTEEEPVGTPTGNPPRTTDWVVPATGADCGAEIVADEREVAELFGTGRSPDTGCADCVVRSPVEDDERPVFVGATAVAAADEVVAGASSTA